MTELFFSTSLLEMVKFFLPVSLSVIPATLASFFQRGVQIISHAINQNSKQGSDAPSQTFNTKSADWFRSA